MPIAAIFEFRYTRGTLRGLFGSIGFGGDLREWACVAAGNDHGRAEREKTPAPPDVGRIEIELPSEYRIRAMPLSTARRYDESWMS